MKIEKVRELGEEELRRQDFGSGRGDFSHPAAEGDRAAGSGRKSAQPEARISLEFTRCCARSSSTKAKRRLRAKGA